MKNVLSYSALFVIAFIISLIGSFQENQVLIYGGVALAGFLILSIALYLFKFLAKLIGKSLSSSLYLCALAAIVALLSIHSLISPVIALSSGAVIGIMMILITIRVLGRKALTSVIFGEVFGFLTGYQLKAYIARRTILTDEQKSIETNDYKNIILVLKEMGFKKEEQKELARFAVDESPLDLP